MNKSEQRYGVEKYKQMLERQRQARLDKYRDDLSVRQRRLDSSSSWKKSNRAKCNISWNNYRAKKKAVGGTHNSDDILLILSEQGYKCPGCLNKFSDELPATIDHFVAISKGGTNSPENIHLMCGPCNYSKQNKAWADWMAG